MGKGFRLDLPFLFDSVHVDPISELFFSGIFLGLTLAVDEVGGGLTALSHLWLSREGQGICDLLWERSTDLRHEVNTQKRDTMLTFWKFEEIPKAWFPSLRSEAIATQPLPTMATTDPPLYSIIDCEIYCEIRESGDNKRG